MKYELVKLTHTFNSQVDLAFSLFGLFAWREISSPDGDGSFRVFTDPLQGFFRCHLPPCSLKSWEKRMECHFLSTGSGIVQNLFRTEV